MLYFYHIILDYESRLLFVKPFFVMYNTIRTQTFFFFNLIIDL